MTCQDPLDELVRQGAQRMLQQAIENEIAEYLQRYADERDSQGHRLGVRNGRLPQRQILTPAGPVEIHQPRVHDQREGHKFVSQLLPPYLRRTPSLDALVPALYLRGISTGDFTEALSSILGANAAGLSATNIGPAQGGMAERLCAVAAERFERQTLCVLVGRRHLFQRAFNR